jgi:hypothetical protein
MSNTETYLWVEKCLGRKLTNEEKQRIDLDIEVAKRINTGNVDNLRNLGIEI